MPLSLCLSWLFEISNEMMMMKKSGDVAGDGILPLATGDCCLQVVLVAYSYVYTIILTYICMILVLFLSKGL